MTWEELLEQYKPCITPKEYTFAGLLQYVTDRYTCDAPIELFEGTYYPEKFKVELKEAGVENCDLYGCRIVRDQRSKNLYDQMQTNFDEDIVLYIEKDTGYIQTNSNALLVELAKEESVTKEDYDTNSMRLIYLASLLHQSLEEE